MYLYFEVHWLKGTIHLLGLVDFLLFTSVILLISISRSVYTFPIVYISLLPMTFHQLTWMFIMQHYTVPNTAVAVYNWDNTSIGTAQRYFVVNCWHLVVMWSTTCLMQQVALVHWTPTTRRSKFKIIGSPIGII